MEGVVEVTKQKSNQESENQLQVQLTEAFRLMSENPFVWGKVFVKEHFRLPSPPFHIKILFEAVKSTFFACASPRESAKSTIIAFLLPLHYICHKKVRFILIVSTPIRKPVVHLTPLRNRLVTIK